jgi:AraC family transcriptional regulator of adaptative response/methylated-DNA-[protein]-cysteine methyltransferase
MRRGLEAEFPLAEIDLKPSASLKPMLDAAVAAASAKQIPVEFPLDIRGTAFQWRVWRALTRIPRGETRSYSEVARAIGRPSAIRAVARACATNPVALVVPCHRVVSKAGAAGGYRWGRDVKKKLLTREKK